MHEPLDDKDIRHDYLRHAFVVQFCCWDYVNCSLPIPGIETENFIIVIGHALRGFFRHVCCGPRHMCTGVC